MNGEPADYCLTRHLSVCWGTLMQSALTLPPLLIGIGKKATKFAKLRELGRYPAQVGDGLVKAHSSSVPIHNNPNL